MFLFGIIHNIPCFVATGILLIATFQTVAPFVKIILLEGISQAELCFNHSFVMKDFVFLIYLFSVSSIFTKGISQFK
jgi:hypothetical protein